MTEQNQSTGGQPLDINQQFVEAVEQAYDDEVAE
jgi:hypothetical protein